MPRGGTAPRGMDGLHNEGRASRVVVLTDPSIILVALVIPVSFREAATKIGFQLGALREALVRKFIPDAKAEDYNVRRLHAVQALDERFPAELPHFVRGTFLYFFKNVLNEIVESDTIVKRGSVFACMLRPVRAEHHLGHIRKETQVSLFDAAVLDDLGGESKVRPASSIMRLTDEQEA